MKKHKTLKLSDRVVDHALEPYSGRVDAICDNCGMRGELYVDFLDVVFEKEGPGFLCKNCNTGCPNPRVSAVMHFH